MLFPLLHVPGLGDGMTIALVAVVHVLISHGLAIGALALIVGLEHLSLTRGDQALADLARRMLKPAVIVITGVGAVTGAGIWFTVSAVAPGGIGAMLRVFFWPWLIEWIAFTLEVLVLLPYYFWWDRMRASRPGVHVALGWSYVGVAFVSAFLISGILGFMLTPDGWVQNRNLAAAFFNPTFWPQLALRMSGGFALGGLVCLAYAAFARNLAAATRRFALRLFGGWLLAFGALCAGSSWLYFSRIPETYAVHKVFAVLTSHLSQSPWLLPAGTAVATGVVALAGVAGWLRSRSGAAALVVPALVAAVLLVSGFERIREFVRGPYLMPGYMYANQIPLALSDYYKEHGYLAHTAWHFVQDPALKPQAPAGHDLFMANCGVCHTIGGVNDIRERLAGRTLPGVNVLVSRTEAMVPFMPPFSGTRAEARTMAAYLYELAGNPRGPRSMPAAGEADRD